ncbi:hypothetical protein A5724_22610 [Mycobacterium sp. ACS1612]|nr:hypothetical protein A5724_22610 [Mycobacterium sp. ACS1612]
MVPSANVAGDPVAVLNSVLQISETSAQVTAQLGRSFLSALGIDVGGQSVGTGITRSRESGSNFPTIRATNTIPTARYRRPRCGAAI